MLVKASFIFSFLAISMYTQGSGLQLPRFNIGATVLYQLLFSGSYHAGLTGVGKRLLLLLPSWLRNLSSLKMETQDNPCKSSGMRVFWRGRHMSRHANILPSSTIYRKWNCVFELNHISFGAKALPRLDWTHVLQTSLWANSPMCAAFLCIWMQLYVHCTSTKVNCV